MGYVRDFKKTEESTNQSSFTATLPDSYETGDTLVFCAVKDTNVGGTLTTPSGWTAAQTNNSNNVSTGLFYKENVTAASESNPTTTSTDTDSWSGMVLSIGGVPTSSVVDVSGIGGVSQPTDGETATGSITTTVSDALVLVFSGMDGSGGQFISDEVALINYDDGSDQSLGAWWLGKPSAGQVGPFNIYQGTDRSIDWAIIALKNNSKDPISFSGGLSDSNLINGFQALETDTWLPTGFPSGITGSPTMATLDGYTVTSTTSNLGDTGDANVSPYARCVQFDATVSLTNINGFRFEADRTGGAGTYDISSSDDYFIMSYHGLNWKNPNVLDVISETTAVIVLEDGSGNWKAWNITGRDASRLLITPNDGCVIIDPANTDHIDSNGTLSTSAIRYVSVLSRGALSNSRQYFSMMAKATPFTITGGNSSAPIDLDIFRVRQLGGNEIMIKQTGTSYSLFGTYFIGDATIDTILDISDVSIIFSGTGPTNGIHITDGLFGFKFLGTASSDLSLTGCNLISDTPWRWNQANTLGTMTFTGNTFTNCDPLTVDTADYSDSTFSACATVDQNGAILDDCTIDSTIGDAGLIWGDGSKVGLTISNCSVGAELQETGTYDISDITFTSNTTDINVAVASGIVNIQLGLGQSTPTTTTDGATINILQPDIDYSVTNAVAGSRLQIYNVTSASEIVNTTLAGTSYAGTYKEGGDFTTGDTVRVRLTYQSGTSAKEEFVQSTTAGSSGWTVLAAQVDDDIYNAYGVDGSTITEFSFDGSNIEVDINDADNTTVIQRLGAWYSYYITTSDGVAILLGAINWESLNSIKIITSMVDLKLDNTKATPLFMNGGRLYRDDDTTVIASTSNSIQMDYDPVYVTDVDTSGIGEELWDTVLVNQDRPNGSAGDIVQNLPKVIARKGDL